MNSSVKTTAEKESEDRLRPSEDRGKDVFSDEEVLELEQELIETYLMSADRPIRILLRMYRKYIGEILLSMFFYCIKTLPCIVLPIITAKIINLAANPSEDFAKRMLIYIVIMVFVLILNIPTHMLHIKYYSIVSRKVEAGLRGAMSTLR